MGGNKFILRQNGLLDLAAFGGRYLHGVSQTGPFADFFDVLIEFLVPEEGEFVRIFVQDFAQFLAAGDDDPLSSFLLDNS